MQCLNVVGVTQMSYFLCHILSLLCQPQVYITIFSTLLFLQLAVSRLTNKDLRHRRILGTVALW